MTDNSVVITGIGMVVPLGMSSMDVLAGLERGETARQRPEFDLTGFDCPYYAAIPDFDAEAFFPENKMLRLMNRDAQFAAAAAQLAMQDAGVISDETYAGEEIALFGSTGVAGMSVEEAASIVRHATCDDGTFDLQRFGKVGLKKIRPVISFKILANMPLCFVSILQNTRGPNAVYSPWEGNGAHAIAAGIRAIKRGDVPCALVGGCDVKTRELSFINLQQLGVFESWKLYGNGCIPGEGSVFLVLEEEKHAAARNRTPYARIKDYSLYSTDSASTPELPANALHSVKAGPNPCHLISACDGSGIALDIERKALESNGLPLLSTIQPKPALGDLFSAAAFVQVAVGAALFGRPGFEGVILANCMGYGSEKAIFMLEAA